MKLGSVVLVFELNALGTVTYAGGTQVEVRLSNGDLWLGEASGVQEDPSPEQVAATKVEVEKKYGKGTKSKRRQ